MSDSSWLEALQQEIDKPGNSQNKVAKELGISSSKLSQTIRGVYPGSTEDIQIKVESLYMNRCVDCPVKGQILISECAENQQRPFSSSNRERIRLYKACRSGCPHSKLEATSRVKTVSVTASENDIYNLDNQLAFLKRESKGNALRLNELLETELVKLAAKYNQLLWSTKYQGRRG